MAKSDAAFLGKLLPFLSMMALGSWGLAQFLKMPVQMKDARARDKKLGREKFDLSVEHEVRLPLACARVGADRAPSARRSGYKSSWVIGRPTTRTSRSQGQSPSGECPQTDPGRVHPLFSCRWIRSAAGPVARRRLGARSLSSQRFSRPAPAWPQVQHRNDESAFASHESRAGGRSQRIPAGRQVRLIDHSFVCALRAFELP